MPGCCYGVLFHCHPHPTNISVSFNREKWTKQYVDVCCEFDFLLLYAGLLISRGPYCKYRFNKYKLHILCFYKLKIPRCIQEWGDAELWCTPSKQPLHCFGSQLAFTTSLENVAAAPVPTERGVSTAMWPEAVPEALLRNLNGTRKIARSYFKGGEKGKAAAMFPDGSGAYLTLWDMCKGVSISSKMAPFTLEPLRLASCRSQPDRSQFWIAESSC